MRRRSRETRSRSARNVTQSFPSNMALFWKKKNEKVRIQSAVPSFFTSIGTSVTVSSPKEARETAEKNRPCAVVLIPDADVYAKPRAWASALSSASYLVVIGDKKDKSVRNFMRIVDGVIFSPVPRHLSSAFIAESREEALSLISGVLETFPTAITIRVEHNVDEEDEE